MVRYIYQRFKPYKGVCLNFHLTLYLYTRLCFKPYKGVCLNLYLLCSQYHLPGFKPYKGVCLNKIASKRDA